MPRLSLTLRAFLFSMLPVCIVLLCCFGAVNAAIHDRIRRELRDQSQASDALLDRANAEWSRRTSAMVSKLADTAGVKAAVGLLAEGRQDEAVAAQVRTTIELQLRELQISSGFDLLAVTGSSGRVIALVKCPSCPGSLSHAVIPLHQGLAAIDGTLYQVDPLPIDYGGETAAVLVLGTRFNLRQLLLPGDAMLAHSGKVIASTLPDRPTRLLEPQIATGCKAEERSSEASFGGQEYVISRLQEKQLGADYCLLGVRSLDGPVRDFTRSFAGTLVSISGSGLLLALLCTVFTSRSVSSPLRALVAQLNHTATSGDLSERLTAGRAVRELALLADAYNAVAASAQRARGQLEIAKDAAQTANRLKDEFLTNVSHELRTPLNGILGMTDLLLQTSLDADQHDFAVTAHTSGEALVTIVDDILTFSQLQRGKLALCERPFDLKNLLASLAARTTEAARAKRLQVELFYPDVDPRMFVGDEIYIRQIVRHLCDNAVKFTNAGKVRISLACVLEPSIATVTVSVHDTGIGIAAADHELIFERFTQSDGSSTRQRGGTGLGLALVKALVARMGGQVGVESSPGEGSRFWFTVPLKTLDENCPEKSVSSREVGCIAC